MARRSLLTEEGRRLLFGVPENADALTRLYSFTRSDRELLAARRGNANRLGFVLRHGAGAHGGTGRFARRLAGGAPGDPGRAFAKYAARTQTMTDHARILAGALGLRPASAADLPFMIEAAAQSAWSTDRGQSIVAGVIAALCAEKVILPAPAVIERAAMAGRARARKRAADALLAGVSEAQTAKLDQLLAADPMLKASRFAWLRNAPSSPKADHVGQLIERLRFVRDIGMSADAATRVTITGSSNSSGKGGLPTRTRSAAMPRTGRGRSWPPMSSTSKPA